MKSLDQEHAHSGVDTTHVSAIVQQCQMQCELNGCFYISNYPIKNHTSIPGSYENNDNVTGENEKQQAM